MTEIIETIKSDNYVANIHIDDMSFSPREDDNFGTLIAFHSKYDLSDNQDFTKEELIEHIQRDDIFALPVYFYEHSSIALSTAPFNCEWDSGQVGYIFVTYEDIEKEGWNTKQAEKFLISEIETYSNYINGDVYRYKIYKKGDCKYCSDDIDSSCGYIGYEWVKEAVKDQLKYFEEKKTNE
jgi:hypothetical protein